MKAYLTQVWWHLTVTLAFEMWRQEDQDFNAILGYVRSFQREREVGGGFGCTPSKIRYRRISRAED